ncbi:polysaccharide deacetylase [Selenomonas sp. oral taxon 126]|uniref:polysaccharide deacetylase family protein n=1 Tax=Selenomonas sp. oral taxon 126 TaxID=712528 RepID=UPI000807767D|nr:polysaccharide deacetylase family protein [Selenomonas sp. oral taxon 126]ANR71131.1 polysaccharide deacetylase [Selenomonas sp. oral taxon 126]
MRNRNALRILIGVFCLLSLCVGMKEAAAADYQELRAANGGRIAQAQRFITTVKPAVIFTFGGLSKQEPLDDILNEMAARGMRGTFFVTEREIQRNGDNIARIVAAGQDLGIGLRPEEGADFDAYCAQIERIQTALRTRWGVETNIVRQMSGADEEAIGEAVSAMGCVLVGQGLNVVQSKHKDAQTAEELMPQLFGRWTTSLNRGEIVYLRTDFYTRSALTGEIFRAIIAEKLDNIAYAAPGASNAQLRQDRQESGYTVASVQDVLADTAALYTYPVDMDALPEEMRPYVRAEKLEGSALMKEFFKRYVGAPEVGETDRMLDFSRVEMRQADRTGIVKTVADNTIFLSFDDWGSDDSINHILYVLRKHKVQGTFFVITWNIHNNPNLLRAIAAEGHEIGSHTDGHKPMTIQDEKGRQIPVQNPEEYNEDVRSSYEKLAATVGDMKLPSGRYALTRLLRPPTLAVSRMGVAAILNNGFTYVVNGSGSTEDYSTVSMESLVGILHNLTHEEDGSVKRGAILVMHMSSTAARTAVALDILLTANDSLPDGHPGKFKVGLLGDYLTGDYDQSMKQVKPAAGYHLH